MGPVPSPRGERGLPHLSGEGMAAVRLKIPEMQRGKVQDKRQMGGEAAGLGAEHLLMVLGSCIRTIAPRGLQGRGEN